MNNPIKGTNKRTEDVQAPLDNTGYNSVLDKIESYEKEKLILLGLSEEITSFRSKQDIIKRLSLRLSGFFKFSHIAVSLVDQKSKTCFPLLCDVDSHPNKNHPRFAEAINARYSVDDPFFAKLWNLETPASFLVKEILAEDGLPLFLRLNAIAGIERILVVPLRKQSETLGFVYVSSKSSEQFPHDFERVLQGIAPLMANAVENIVLTEEILDREVANETLLELSNDLITVRDWKSLFNIINGCLRKLIRFSHCVITEVGDTGEYYRVLSTDPEGSLQENDTTMPVNDGIHNLALQLNTPLVMKIDTIGMNTAPSWVRSNIEAGRKEAMIKPLSEKDKRRHVLILFSDTPGTFDDNAIRIVARISSQLATAATNILANDEIQGQDRDKAFLIDFSHDVASARTRKELSIAIHRALKKLSEVRAYFIRIVNSDGATMSPFMHDKDVFYVDSPQFQQLLATPIPTNVGITARVLSGNNPVLIDFAEEIKHGNTDHYIAFWQGLGPKRKEFQKMYGTPLRTGSATLGILWVITPRINVTLLEGICAQISVAISNIRSNEEIAEREEEKSILLSLSGEIAALRNRTDLLKVVNTQFKILFAINDFGFLQRNEDGTYTTFILDLGDHITSLPEFEGISSARFPATVPLFSMMVHSDNPIIFDVQELAATPGMPAFVHFWRKLGLRRVLGLGLRVGGKDVGCAFLHIDANRTGNMKINLLKAVCAQISVAMENIRSHEEIADREAEKSVLLSLSDEIAALRSRNDLFHIVNTRVKALFGVSEFGIAQIDDDRSTYSAFVLDLGDALRSRPEYADITSGRYRVDDPVFRKVMGSPDAILLNVAELVGQRDMPAYVKLWHHAGISHVLAAALRVGGREIGCAFLHTETNAVQRVKINLLKAVCAQLSVAVSNILANEQVLGYKQMLEVENDRLKAQIKGIYNFSDIVGNGPAMRQLYHMMSLVASTNSTVLLLGETGTGKELIARAIHNASTRKDKLMIKVNCAALPANLIESELFGHEKGAFTGAIERRIGKFELANNSTLFLDEIGEMPLEMQVKLLRTLQERELERVGGKTTIRVDVRIIAATNRNLEEEVNAGRFRSDLYYRLNVFPITLPPLRDRLEDIALLTDFFVARYSKNTGKKITSVSAKVIQELTNYSWPGNVRELEHLIERSILLTPGNVLREIQLPKRRGEIVVSHREEISGKTLLQLERSHIIEVLKECKGKISGIGGAADVLELPSTTLHSKMKKLGISKKDYFPGS